MTVVNLESVRNNFGIRLYRDSKLISLIETAEFISPTTKVFTAPTLQGIRVDSVYELVGGVWTKRTDLRVSGDNLLLDTATANQLMIVPKGCLSIVQIGTNISSPIEIFVKTFPGFIAENFEVTTYDTETAAPGPFEFSLTSNGTYTSSLGPIVMPASFFMRSKAASVLDAKKTIPIVVTSDIYL